MAKVELKKPVIDEISNVIADADGVVLVNYSGLTVAQDTELRRTLREAGIAYKVYKNTMMNFAFQGTPCEELCKHLEGTNALAVSKDDATAPARVLAAFAKKNPKLELVAGVVEGNYYDAAGVQALSAIPSREELLGKLLDSDEGSRGIGEIALVPASSPIRQSGLLFYNTLFDENAACHIAFGRGYPTNIKGGTGMTTAQLLEKGLNDSAIHEDVMVGSPDMTITGLTRSGETVEIFRHGEWAF